MGADWHSERKLPRKAGDRAGPWCRRPITPFLKARMAVNTLVYGDYAR